MRPGSAPAVTAAAMSAELAAGRVTSRELVERSFASIEAWQPVTNAFSQVWAEEGLATAGRLDAARAAGDAVGRFAGIPVAVKDLYDVAGHETSGCCRAYAGRIARSDAPTVARLRAAGLVIIGKTNQHELAAGGTNLVSACGPTANPWDPGRITGGSSGGSAAAVAAGSVPWALGSDTGGSIRIPSALCGAFGLKPTTGAVTIEGMLPLAPSMDCPGPIAATAADVWTLQGILAGTGAPPSEPGAGGEIRAPRIGVPDGLFRDRVQWEVLRAVRSTSAELSAAGAEVIDVDGHGIDDARSVWSRICWAEFARAQSELDDPEHRRLVAPEVLEWIERGEAIDEPERRELSRRREEIGDWFRERLGGLDALLVPTTPYPAPAADQERVELGQETGAGAVRVDRVGPGFLTCVVNLAGLPAVSLPVALSGDGLPIGVSLVGWDGQEERLLAIAGLWERASGHRPLNPTA